MAASRDFTPGVVAFASGFCLIFLVAGSVLIGAFYQERQTAQQAMTWPEAEGEVVEFAVGQMQQKGLPHVRMIYRYTVRNETFQGSRIVFGSFDLGDVRRWQDYYETGKLIPVFYDPDQPSRAVLEPAARASTWVMPIFGGVLLTGGLLMSRWFVNAWLAEIRRLQKRR